MDRLAVLEAQVAAASRFHRIAQLVSQHSDTEAVPLIAEELGCELATARQIWSTPLRMFGAENTARARAEAAELRSSAASNG
ncbi:MULTISPECIES: hypothetical protein [Curtobacterium]|uniref:hypothetical protein n=1 Tax=Curtobacterium flaccumfaciens TaxID=2035 RepID=UPI003EE73E53